MNKKKMILTSLASVAVLGAAFVASQPSVVKADDSTTSQPTATKPAGETGAADTSKSEVTSPEIKKAEDDAKAAEAKVTEAQAKVDTTTTAANEANTKLEAEKKEAADAKTAKTEAEEAKKAADAELAAAKEKAAEADAKAKEEAKKEADAKKEEADSKEALTEALKQLPDNELLDKKAKEDLLKAVEAGDLKASDILTELADDDKKAEANKETEKKLRDKDQASTANADATPAKEAKTKDQLPADIKAGIDKAEKADAARPASEKLQDKADDLGENVDELKEDAEALKAEEDKKAEALKKQEDTLKEAKEALKSAQDNGSDADIVASLDKAVKAIEKAKEVAQDAFDKAASDTQVVAEELNKLTDEYNKALDEVKAAKEKEANEPAKPAEEEPAKPAEKTEAEKAAEAKKEADAKVAELQKKADEAKTKVDEATAKATKEAEDVTAAEEAKTTADKAKTDAEAELAKATKEAEKAKAKVEELKKEEKDNLEALKAALDQLEKEIDADAKITNKDEAKAAIGKDALLKAIEDGVITATQAAKELEDQNATAKANKDVENKLRNKDQVNDATPATTAPTIKHGDKQPAEDSGEKISDTDKKAFDEADKKEASKPIVKKLQDIADDIAEKIEKLTKVADKDKADATEKAKAVEEKTAALNKQKETLDKAKAALETAKKNNAEQAIQDGLQDAVTKLEAAVASAKTAADEAQAKFDEVNEVVKAYKDEIDKLTDDYNATLGYIENLKEVPKDEEQPKDFAGGVNDDEAPTGDAKQPDEVPTVPNAPEFNGGVNPADAPTAEEKPEFTGGVNDEEAPTTPTTPEFNGGVNDDNATTQPNNPEFNGGVNDTTPPTEPVKPEGEAPKTAKPETSNGDALVQPELPEFGANNPEIKKILDEIAKVKEQIKDSEENEGVEDYYKEGLKDRLSDLEDAFDILTKNLPAVNEVPEFNEPLTGHFDIADLGNPNAEAIEEGEVGESKPKEIKGYKFVRTVKDGNVTKHYYQKLNTPATPGTPAVTPGNPPRENSNATAVNEPALVPTTPAAPGTDASATPTTPRTDAPAMPTAETPTTPAVAPTVAGTSQDNTYQAPAAKADEKKELPNTGGKDNVAIASLGFLGLLLGALPFVKRKN
ncbi:maebl [Streptococcus mitis 27/7]|uniref:SIALI-17 repeat-containing surface protein n=1 Tax=Streptococcus mitis TaxID=28037 RepID=UPI0003D348A9|nr:SIALI-17 repeat-containing surface protein [Streptococcus mitis]ETD97436.1 maebl [Streptococcus mitis 27/7]MBT2175105.1 LPXTG cell wall anchor domain-containing protein [Streptococcus mitis]